MEKIKICISIVVLYLLIVSTAVAHVGDGGTAKVTGLVSGKQTVTATDPDNVHRIEVYGKVTSLIGSKTFSSCTSPASFEFAVNNINDYPLTIHVEDCQKKGSSFDSEVNGFTGIPVIGINKTSPDYEYNKTSNTECGFSCHVIRDQRPGGGTTVDKYVMTVVIGIISTMSIYIIRKRKK